MSVIGFCSRGMRRISFLDALTEARCDFFALHPGKETTHVAGWGRKPTAARARKVAAQSGLPFVSLEDGFLRSYGLGVSGAPLHSLVVDYSGIYYDVTAPSDLETLISKADFDGETLDRARICMGLLREHRLSKYNCAPDSGVTWPDAHPRVLVVDQTFGDASVSFGGADVADFARMLDAAIAENPDAEVVVKIHPDVIAGKKRGYLLDAAKLKNCRLWAEDINPWALLDAVEKVYVVTSQMGFDALLAGKKVHCFGLPFYAGWGLTKDSQTCPRRGLERTLEQVFTAAYLRYCRYINPYTGERCALEDTIRLIAEQKRQGQRAQGQWLALGFSPWKRGFVPDFLGRPSNLKFAGRVLATISNAARGTRIAMWASSLPSSVVELCKKRGLELWRLEDGFLRSVGLGSDLVRPLSLVLDRQGIYYDASRPSTLETMLRETKFGAELLERAAALRTQLVAQQLSKYNVGASPDADTAALTLPADQIIILVPGQVESDASIAHGSPWLKTNRQLLLEVRRENPEAFIIYKPHPDVLVGGRVGELVEDGSDLFDLLVTDVPMPTLLARVDEVHTLSSLSGFEALLRSVKVVTYGLPFYAGWGLTDDRLLEMGDDAEVPHALHQLASVRRCLKARGRNLTLDELVAGTLILYPTYVDPRCGDTIEVETAVQILQMQRGMPAADGWRRRIYRAVRNRFFRK